MAKPNRYVLFMVCTLVGFASSQLAHPPFGSTKLESVQAKGVQQYVCNASSWINVGALAELYPSWATTLNDSTRIGHHYFLPYPDHNGGKATWSHFTSPGAASTPPTSTITGKVLAREPVPGTIDKLILQATSFTGNTHVAYIQRLPTSGGVPDASTCKEGALLSVPYTSNYTFWGLEENFVTIIWTNKSKTIAAYFGDGYQHYRYNGTSWALVNATATLSILPGREIVGAHYFLPEKDARGGQPTWEVFSPKISTITAKPVRSHSFDVNSIPWVMLTETCNNGVNGIALAKTIDRINTRAGLPPKTAGTTGQEYLSPYSAVYLFVK